MEEIKEINMEDNYGNLSISMRKVDKRKWGLLRRIHLTTPRLWSKLLFKKNSNYDITLNNIS